MTGSRRLIWQASAVLALGVISLGTPRAAVARETSGGSCGICSTYSTCPDLYTMGNLCDEDCGGYDRPLQCDGEGSGECQDPGDWTSNWWCN